MAFTPERLLVLRISGWIPIYAVALLAGVPDGPDHVHLAALTPSVGLGVGALLFLTLAGGPSTVWRISRSRVPSIVARGGYLLGQAAVEEIVWRAYVFGLTMQIAGAGPAFVVSTLGFAAAHLRSQGRQAWVQLVTGGAFAAVFYTTSSLTAAILAHGTYNLLVALAVESARRAEAPRESPTTLRPRARPS